MYNIKDIIINHPMEDDFFNKFELALFYEIFNSGEYNFLIDEIKNSKIIFDIGSHIGFFSLYCLENNPNLKIYSFEANSSNFKKNKIILKIYKNRIIFNNVFVDYKSGFNNIHINKDKTMQSSFYTNTFLNKSNLEEKIKSIDLYKYINSKKLNYTNSLDIVKIDIEGYEFDLLLNIDENIFSCIKILVFEYHLFEKCFEKKQKLLLTKLKKFYKNIQIIKSKYTNKIGLIYCKK